MLCVSEADQGRLEVVEAVSKAIYRRRRVPTMKVLRGRVTDMYEPRYF